MVDPILDLLNGAELRTLVVNALTDTCALAETIHDNPSDDMKDLQSSDLWEEAWWRAQTSRGCGVERAFRENLFAKMPEPLRMTSEETLSAFWAVAKPLQYSLTDNTPKYAEGVYSAFLNLLANDVLDPGDLPLLTVARISSGGSCLFAEWPTGFIAQRLVPWDDDPEGIEDLKRMDELDGPARDAESRAENWLKANGLWWEGNVSVSVSVNSAGVSGDEWPSAFYLETGYPDELPFLEARVIGRISQQAGSKLTSKLDRVLPSVIRSTAVVQKSPNPAAEDAFVIECERRLPVITLNALVENIQFVRRCVDAYFRRPSKKDSMDRRIRNAVTLLVESDTQLIDAVGLGLSVTAIEALLGEKGEGVAERLSNNLAVLLEPDRDVRTKAVTFFKKLYGQRSDALHGRELDNMSEHRHNGRRVAAAVLYSVVNRQDFLRRGGFGSGTPEELLRDLRDCHWSGGPPMGIPELPITQLWRES